MPTLNSYKGVIFDLDGTLADTLEDIAGSMNRVLETHGFPIRPVIDYKLLVGRGLDNLVTQALPAEERQPEMIRTCLAEMISDYTINCLVKTHLYDGISELLHELTKRSIRIAVFSNKAEPLTNKIVKFLMAGVPFVSVVGAKPEFPKKPNPQGALIISREMGLPPSEIIYVGDSDVDMITATKAGMLATGVSWGFRSVEELKSNGAGIIINTPSDLLPYFSQITI
jgi:phosphoglycolate phosphatase